jgi:hypothetical protein
MRGRRRSHTQSINGATHTEKKKTFGLIVDRSHDLRVEKWFPEPLNYRLVSVLRI